jgi:hypothetical protein
MVSVVALGAVVNTDLLPRHLPFLRSERRSMKMGCFAVAL